MNKLRRTYTRSKVSERQILAKELCIRILNARTWQEAMHYQGQAVRLGVTTQQVHELDGMTPANSYYLVDQMLNNCLWTNGLYLAWSVDGKIQGLAGKLARDLENEGWTRVIDVQKELGLEPNIVNETIVTGCMTVKELRNV
jgi:hypothetical protein